MPTNIKKIEKILNYRFKDASILEKALTHASYANEQNCASNERMEFLGDAVLQIIVSDYIFFKSDKDEGVLSKIRSNAVSSDSLSRVSLSLGLDKFLLLGESQRRNMNNLHFKTYANLYEALLCAIYLDGGLDKAKEFVLATLKEVLDEGLCGNFYDSPKTELQEYCQKYKIILKYKLVGKKGPDHNPQFIYAVLLDDKVYGEGQGQSKLTAQTDAAVKALDIIYKRSQP